jgi:hypothetical protein
MLIWEETLTYKKEPKNAEFIKDRLERTQKRMINIKRNLKLDGRKMTRGDI